MTQATAKQVHVKYYALLREQRGLSSEKIATSAASARHLYDELCKQYKFTLGSDRLRVAINNQFVDWNASLNDDDTIVFVPPVAGG